MVTINFDDWHTDFITGPYLTESKGMRSIALKVKKTDMSMPLNAGEKRPVLCALTELVTNAYGPGTATFVMKDKPDFLSKVEWGAVQTKLAAMQDHF